MKEDVRLRSLRSGKILTVIAAAEGCAEIMFLHSRHCKTCHPKSDETLPTLTRAFYHPAEKARVDILHVLAPMGVNFNACFGLRWQRDMRPLQRNLQ